MSKRTIIVCEECGRQTTDGDAWMVMSSINILTSGTRESLVRSAIDLDLCSPGCLLRYISRELEFAQGRHPLTRTRVHTEKHNDRSGVAA